MLQTIVGVLTGKSDEDVPEKVINVLDNLRLCVELVPCPTQSPHFSEIAHFRTSQMGFGR
jgi:hypothetical protein